MPVLENLFSISTSRSPGPHFFPSKEPLFSFDIELVVVERFDTSFEPGFTSLSNFYNSFFVFPKESRALLAFSVEWISEVRDCKLSALSTSSFLSSRVEAVNLASLEEGLELKEWAGDWEGLADSCFFRLM